MSCLTLARTSSLDCDWTSFQLELGLEDIDSDTTFQKEGLLKEQVISDDDGCILPPTFPSASASSTSGMIKHQDFPKKAEIQVSCPWCKKPHAAQPSFHEHVSRCFMKKAETSSKYLEEDRSSTKYKIDSIRQNVSRLNLRQRITLMESLSRLAHATTTAHETRDSVTQGSQQDDSFLLSLLYSKPKFEKKTLLKSLKVECPDSCLVPTKERFTPTLVAKDAVPFDSPPPHPMPPCRSTKRKALQFSPESSSYVQPTKAQRLRL